MDHGINDKLCTTKYRYRRRTDQAAVIRDSRIPNPKVFDHCCWQNFPNRECSPAENFTLETKDRG